MFTLVCTDVRQEIYSLSAKFVPMFDTNCNSGIHI